MAQRDAHDADNQATGGLLWEGDAGSLSFDSRRALVQLLTGPLVRASAHPQLWHAISSDEQSLRARLAYVFLDLIIDFDAGIAFTRPAHGGQPILLEGGRYVDMPKVLRMKTLTVIDTIILLDLRTQLGLAMPGERVIVDVEDLKENALHYRRAVDADEAGFQRRFDAALKRIRVDYTLLMETETEGRYEVSPVLRHMFDAQTVAGIKAEFEDVAQLEEQE